MFRIGEFSKMSKTTIKALRFYDKIGLLKPEEIDKFTGYRMYTTDQLFKLHKIQSLRQIGLSTDEVKSVLSGRDIESILNRRKTELQRGISEAQTQLSKIEFILKGDEIFMDYVATIKQIPECIVYSKRMTVPNYDAYFQVIPALGEQVTNKYPDLKCATPAYCFIVYHDGEYKEKDINIEYCEAVTEIKNDFDGIIFKKIPQATVVSIMHKGAYQKLREAYAYIFKWIDENGYKILDNPRESYIDGIWNKENEEDWLTELQVPIAKK